MSVDLSKLRVGDTIELRDGSRHVVTRINSSMIHTERPRAGRTEGSADTYWCHYENGSWCGSDGTYPGDIVRIHPAGGIGSALDALSKPGVSVKHDDAKPPLALLPTGPLEEVAKVLGFGAKKYGAWNFKGGFAYTRLISAVLRHVFAYARGEDKDPETGLSHLAHAACGLLFLLDQTQTGKGEDDRWKEGAA